MSEDKNKKDWDFVVEEIPEDKEEKKENFQERLQKRGQSELTFDVETKKRVKREENELALKRANRRVYTSSDAPDIDHFEVSKRASFKKRILAGLIDASILIGCSIMTMALFGFLSSQVEGLSMIKDFSAYLGFFGFLYLFMIRGLNQNSNTPGKKAFHLEVITQDGPYLEVGTAFMREFIGKLASLLLFPLALLLMGFHKKGRTIHDFITGTMVVDTE